ncbi:AraC family transcriptional regulator [Nonomuraea lactucae]|uniref:AraC family transcriptional regulator n=1 Tax=Nonomuraea lactucae TaxID=2249762 RepID=UPI000DE303E3|nr:AraC family transcriptional regulator [Nonomuraea lactucae]
MDEREPVYRNVTTEHAAPEAGPAHQSSPWTIPPEADTPVGRLIETTDLDEATYAITTNYAPGRLSLVDARTPLDLRMWINELPGLDLTYMSFGTDVTVVAPPAARGYVVCVPTTGRLRIGTGGEQVEASTDMAAVISPEAPAWFDCWSPDSRVLTVRIDPAEIETLLSALLDQPLTGPIRFRPGLDLRDPAARSFVRTLSLLRSELTHPVHDPQDLIMMSGLTRLVMTGLLLAQPHNYTEHLRRPPRPAAPANIRNAIELIEAHPADITGVADLARAASLSVRALEEGFRRHVGMPPMAYLRKIRLARAHAELQSADPSATTAAAVARRWGFYHYGRFASAYRLRYGTAPSFTLHQAAPGTGL